MKKPKGTRKKYSERLTADEKARIIALTRAGDLKQIEMAAAFHCNVSTIRAVQQAAGLKLWRELTPEVENECVALLRQGIGHYRVSRKTRVSQPKVRELMAKYGIVHRIGGQLLAPEKAAKIREAVKQRRDYCKRIAEKFHVSSGVVQRIAHEVWGPGRFLSAPVWPPMQSIFPQSNCDFVKMTEPDDFMLFVKKVIDTWLGGKLPTANDSVFVAAMMAGLAKTTLAGQPQVILDCFAAGLAEAVDALRQSESSRWKN